ncbi:hypothetical protein RJ640_014199 [Escallonia rubra]|uniref:Retrovirus-related Pol polyprotein from transposon TNT 1-94 n=1 Tax=Escallonia rubra TaxID=112253 RepID=A0AA88R7Y8_9ASTE|nr:hypothetical protein RJ640_014199 [Escallonia rubra]
MESMISKIIIFGFAVSSQGLRIMRECINNVNVERRIYGKSPRGVNKANCYDKQSDFVTSGIKSFQSTMKDILVQQGLLKPLLGNKPESMDQDDWEELQAKVVSTIRLNLGPKVKCQVLTETSPTALWQKLEKIYMSKSLSNRLYLKKDLYQLRMDEGSDLGDHISEFNRLVSQLLSIDV